MLGTLSPRRPVRLRRVAGVVIGVGVLLGTAIGFARASHTTEVWDGFGTGSSDNPNVTKTWVVNDGSDGNPAVFEYNVPDNKRFRDPLKISSVCEP